jgi:hypothetical protein
MTKGRTCVMSSACVLATIVGAAHTCSAPSPASAPHASESAQLPQM